MDIDVPAKPEPIYCIECKDQEAIVFCEQCDEEFCEVCHTMLHRTGNRRKHTAKNFKPITCTTENQDQLGADHTDLSPSSEKTEHSTGTNSVLELDGTVINNSSGSSLGDWMTKRVKHVPLRLSEEERGLLQLLEAALNVSEYTDKVDIISYANKTKRIVGQIRDLCAIISGLLVARNYNYGNSLFSQRGIRQSDEFFQRVFEVGRRYKIMNPEKMRTTYGKLMYMLMDSVIPEVKEVLGFSCVVPIHTVYGFLSERDSLELLYDDYIAMATREIAPEGKTRSQVESEIQRKKRAMEVLCSKYANDRISSEDIARCLLSISDNHAFLRANRDPCEKTLKYLSKYFNPSQADQGYSLAIVAGRHGHRLTHSHETQYFYVQQSMCLWREIMHDMFMLWNLTDMDLTSDNPYRLTNTGQGLQRIQACTRISSPIHKILGRAQSKCGSWVGSSAIHLGDRDVPNAFLFIDKYNQVSRILSPIMNTLDAIESLTSDPHLADYINHVYGGVDRCRKDILYDFFRHGFNGSGADNYFDAGSCIDGRLTSAWNWCSQIEKKKFFPVFLLTGFVGFDGGGW